MPTIIIRNILPGTRGENGQISSVGHAWLEIHNPDGSTESYGYYPAETGIYGKGDVRYTDSKNYGTEGSSSVSIPITDTQAQSIRNYADVTDQFGTYGLFGNGTHPFDPSNCASWLTAAFREADISGQFPATLLLPWFAASRFSGTTAPSDGDPFTGMPWPGMETDINTDFNAAKNWTPPRDPLAGR